MIITAIISHINIIFIIKENKKTVTAMRKYASQRNTQYPSSGLEVKGNKGNYYDSEPA